MTSRQVGASGVTTFAYDGINRLTYVDYPGGTPDVTTVYDGNNNVTSLASGPVNQSYIYDDNDNLLNEVLVVPTPGGTTNTYAFSHTYDNLDFRNTITYPSNSVVTYTPDALGRPTKVGPHVSFVEYHPNRQPKTLTYANGITTTTTLNNRQFVDSISTTGGVAALSYRYDGVGNVRSITDGVSPSASRTMSYDGLDRLRTANGLWGVGSINYDPVGNITNKTIGSDSLTYSYVNNRLTGISGGRSYAFSYDEYANVESDGRYVANYDDASNLVAITIGSNVANHYYDGNKMRVRTDQDGKTTYFVYSKGGELLGEYASDSSYKEYIYLGRQLLATVKDDPNNQAPPVANAGPDQTVNEDAAVVLDGRASTDPDGTIASYSWRQTGGPSVVLSDQASPTPSFIAPAVVADTLLSFTLVVTDNRGFTGIDTVRVTTINSNPGNDPSLDSDGDGLLDSWEMQHFGTLAYGPNDDPDGDGLTNLQEFMEGTNPNVQDPTPGAVQALSATGGISKNTLAWEPVTAAASYNVYWSTTPGVTPSTGTKISGVMNPYVHLDLTNEVTHYYVVTAVNNSGESAPSPEASAKPSFAPLIPVIDYLLSD